MKNILILNGSPLSGKSEFYKILKSISRYSVSSYSSIDWVKDLAFDYFNWSENKKDEKNRRLLADLKKVAIEYDNIPFKSVVEYINYCDADSIVCVDIREPEEIQKVVKFYRQTKHNVITIFINNEKKERTWNNEADDGVFDYKYDWFIDNDGTLEEFREAVEYFYKKEIENEKKQNRSLY